ncbi:hemin uptake protein HemP [Nitrogeniibacter mangrovi]|uniref:hemin uptake protein HemP n=1 Tax=Nitrogeniibacter mangrovi TaxID=2016596 RepID=UPI00156F4D69|nr:hemin uptake protein HemP [Nitrogeniibacter mangrovi]
MPTEPNPCRPLPADGTAPGTPTRDTPIASTQLLQGRASVTIEHKGVHYRLQETRAGKLILTK